MAKIQSLLQQAAVIRDATAEKENTALRIGSMFVSFIEAVMATMPPEVMDATGISCLASSSNFIITYNTLDENGDRGTKQIIIPSVSTENAGLITPDKLKEINKAVSDITTALETASRAETAATGAKSTAEAAKAVTDTKGQPEGIAPLDEGGKVPAEHLPSYVDDVVEFDGIINTSAYGFLGCFKTIPEQFAGYTFGGDSSPYKLQYMHETYCVRYDEGTHKFIAGKHVSAYNGHSIMATFALDENETDMSPYGVVDSEHYGMAAPVAGKIYVDRGTDRQYRWSGSALAQLSRPVGLGTDYDDAFRGSAGVALEQKVESIDNKYADAFYNLTQFLSGFECFNIMGYSADEEAITLEQAVSYLSDLTWASEKLWWPTLGSQIKFLSATGWVRYRYKNVYSGEVDEYTNAANWELVPEATGGGSSADGSCCPHCATYGSQISQLGNLITEVSSQSANAMTTATGAKDVADAAAETLNNLRVATANMFQGLDTFNVNIFNAEGDVEMTLEEAIGCLPVDTATIQLGWPGIGSAIKFLSDNGWVKYRYTYQGYSTEEQVLDVSNWEPVPYDCCPHCADHTTLLNNLSTHVTLAEENANTAHNAATTAQTTANANAQSIATLQTEVNTLKEAQNNAVSVDKVTFCELKAIDADESGWTKGAYSKDSLTYNYPGPNAKYSLRVTADATTGALLLLPESGIENGQIIRIIDPRKLTQTEASTAQPVRITPYTATQKIYGVEKSSDNYWIELKGGYVELMCMRTANTLGGNESVDYVVRSLVKF